MHCIAAVEVHCIAEVEVHCIAEEADSIEEVCFRILNIFQLTLHNSEVGSRNKELA